MADKKLPKNDFVDISSSSDVERVYHPDAAKRKKSVKTSLVLRICSMVMAVLFLITGGIALYYFYFVKPHYDNQNITRTNFMIDYGSTSPDEAKATSDEGKSSDGTKSVPADNPSVSRKTGDNVLLQHEMVLNVMLFGRDSRDPKNTHGLSDTMILLSIDNLHKKIKLTSFQRDTYVCIPGNASEGRSDMFDKLNVAYSVGGERLAIRTIEANFGIRVDKYATVDFDAFRKIVKALGGIDIELTLEEIRYINAQIDVNNQIGKTEFLNYDPNKEKQVMHLDGYQALWYARDRGEENLGGNPEYSFDGDDWDRTARQRNFIQTIINYLRTKASFSELLQVVNAVGPLITTNLKTSEIMFLASNMMTYLGYEMKQMAVPSDGTWSYAHTSDGQSVIVIDDWSKARYVYANFVYEDLITTSKQ